MKHDNHMINQITSHMIDLTQSKQFGIITYPRINLFFIIHHLTYLTVLINFFNQPFQLTFSINLFN